MSQNVSRNSKGTAKVAQATLLSSVNHSTTTNSASSNLKNNNSIPNKSNINNITNNFNNNNTNNSTNLDENHNNKHYDNNKDKLQEALKPTPEQVRLASLLVNKSEDPEINKKIRQISDIFPDKNQDQILMVLHDQDYDLDNALNFLFDGGDLTQDWKLAGIRTNKSKPSPNQTLDETDLNHQTPQNSLNNKNNNNKQAPKMNKNRSRDRDRDINRNSSRFTNKKLHKTNDEDLNKQKLDENFSNLDLKDSININQHEDQDENDNHLDSQEFSENRKLRQQNNRGFSLRGSNLMSNGRGRSHPGGVISNGASFRSSLPPRGSRKYENRKSHNDFSNNFDENSTENLNENNLKSTENLSEQTDLAGGSCANTIVTSGVPGMTPANSLTLQRNRTNEDNLRDIGTWSNEQAQHNTKKSLHYTNSRQQGTVSNGTITRFNNKNLNSNTSNQNQQEEWENDEEWQGDLTQTQIFTSSTQKKESDPPSLSQSQINQNRDFPIGHFNAEEATKNIKKAVGIVSSNPPTVTTQQQQEQRTEQAKPQQQIPNNQILVQNTQQQNFNNKQNTKFPPSSKPLPPPSTKIPKSAVIMPDGSTSNSTNFSLDVQFGVDLDTPINELKEPNQLLSELTQKKISPPVQQQKQQQSPHLSLNKTQNQSNIVTNISRITTPPASSSTSSSSTQHTQSATQSIPSTSQTNQSQQNKVSSTNVQINAPLQQQQNHLNPPTVQTVASNSSLQKSNSITNSLGQTQQNSNTNFESNIQKKLEQQKNQQSYQNQLHQQIQQQQVVNLAKQQQYISQLQTQPQPQRHQYQHQVNKENNQPTTAQSQLLNISPQNGPLSNNTTQNNKQAQQQQSNANTQQQVLSQLQQQINSQNQSIANHQQQNPVNLSQLQNQAAVNISSQKQNQVPQQTATTPQNTTLPPPPGVGLVNPNNLVNPNSQYLISLPFVGFDNQNFPYFDQTQMDTSLIQMYNHLASVPPPGVGNAGAASGPQYPISDSKFTRSEASNSNSQLNVNSSAAAAAQLSQQQQPPINLIPNLNNFPFFFHNYGYPNLYMPIPNGSQAAAAANQQQFQNKPPAYATNFTNNQTYEEQNKDYNNYNPQTQMKSSSSNLSEINTAVNAAVNAAYQKNVDKTQTAGGYHTPPPSNFQNSLLNQQHPNLNSNQAPPPQAQYTYVTSLMTPGANIVHTGMQDNLNQRNVGNAATNLKQIPKSNYQNSSWGQ